MIPVNRMLPIAFLLMLSNSGLLLGFSRQDFGLAIVAITGAVSGLIFCDWLKWIELKNWVANILSIIVLFFAMRTFFEGEVDGQLSAVANLLVYLQLVLLYQRKTPRLYWQLSVLSLLQVVVATIFNLQFEGGLFFLVYMPIAGFALMLLTMYHQNWIARRDEKKGIRKLNPPVQPGTRLPPVAIFHQGPRSSMVSRPMLAHVAMWFAVCLIFSVILFYCLPRSNSAWMGRRFVSSTATGFNKKLELDERGKIKLGSEIVMRCRFIDPKTNKVVQLSQPPYYRGIALSNIELEDGKTTFKAPYDRVYNYLFEPLATINVSRPHLKMEITLEPTPDPLIYGCMPAYANRKTPEVIEFCHEISALTRRRRGERIELAPLKYSLSIPTVLRNAPSRYWPYKPESNSFSARTMRGNLGQRRWLTQIEKDRFPELVRLADELAKGAPQPSDPLSVAREMQQYFLLNSQFKYTLDFSQVVRDHSLDPIEDFVRNHKSGHCSLYAASLCLMLRSQGIPARVVVGYLGGTYNELSETYLVTEQHAHAWVEAYIPPEHCDSQMKDYPAIARSGAWLTLDSTPASSIEFGVGGDALDFARTFWQDYILGLDDESQNKVLSEGNESLLGLLDPDQWRGAANNFDSKNAWSIRLLVVFGLMVAIWAVWSLIKRNKRSNRVSRKSRSKVRELIGKAIGLLQPKLGNWIIHGDSPARTVDFYEKLTGMLKRHGHIRPENQTHREFAESVSNQYREKENWQRIDEVLRRLTEAFNQSRFGNHPLSPEEERRVLKQLADLKGILATEAQ